MKISVEMRQEIDAIRCLTTISENGKEDLCMRENFPSDKEYPTITFTYALAHMAVQLNCYLVNKFRDQQAQNNP